MPLATLRQVLEEAKKKHYGVGAFNVNNMEQIQGIMHAAHTNNSPVIIQASRGALKYTNLVYIKHLMQAAVEENPDIPIVMHLDHGDTIDTVKTAISLGFTSVMIDASAYPFEENVKITREIVNYAHKFGVSVEGELGTLGGIEDEVSNSIKLTDPEKAIEFVKLTSVDALAIAIGTSHGAYKFKNKPKLAIPLVKEISKKVNIPLVMHGSSSVPIELRNEINKYGGKMPNAKGVPTTSIQAAIKNGICKINTDTDVRMAMTASIRKTFHDSPEIFDPREYLGPGRDAITQLVSSKMKAFGTKGHAKDYKVIPLNEAKNFYKK
jgi:fructose-bisphosphate aldolase class II